jgi:hypothetical protein
VIGFHLVAVDTHHQREIGILSRRRDDDALGARLEMLRRRLALGEEAGAFERDIDLQALPRQLGRVALGQHLDLAAAGVHPALAGGDLAVEAAMDAVVFQEMRVGLDRTQIVDRNHLEIVDAPLIERAEDEPPDAPEPIDGNPNSHGLPPA